MTAQELPELWQPQLLNTVRTSSPLHNNQLACSMAAATQQKLVVQPRLQNAFQASSHAMPAGAIQTSHAMPAGRAEFADMARRQSASCCSSHGIRASVSHSNHALYAGSFQNVPDGSSHSLSHSSSAVNHRAPALTKRSSHAMHAGAIQSNHAVHAASDTQGLRQPADAEKLLSSALQQLQAVNSAVCLSLHDEASCSTLLSREGLEQDNIRLRHALSAIEQQLSMLKQDFRLHQVRLMYSVYMWLIASFWGDESAYTRISCTFTFTTRFLSSSSKWHCFLVCSRGD